MPWFRSLFWRWHNFLCDFHWVVPSPNLDKNFQQANLLDLHHSKQILRDGPTIQPRTNGMLKNKTSNHNNHCLTINWLLLFSEHFGCAKKALVSSNCSFSLRTTECWPPIVLQTCNAWSIVHCPGTRVLPTSPPEKTRLDKFRQD